MKRTYKHDTEIDHAELIKRVDYNKETGVFTRLVAISNRSKVGDILSGKHVAGYTVVNVFSEKFLAHRLAWFYEYGEWPDGEVDHINHIRSDNRLCNLRVVAHKDNGRNQTLRSTNCSGTMGVHFIPTTGRWHARITTDSGIVNLGYFKDKESAVKARKEGEKLYSYSETHGTVKNYSIDMGGE